MSEIIAANDCPSDTIESLREECRARAAYGQRLQEALLARMEKLRIVAQSEKADKTEDAMLELMDDIYFNRVASQSDTTGGHKCVACGQEHAGCCGACPHWRPIP